MKLKCPKCKRVLPQIGSAPNNGEEISCGICGHVWVFIHSRERARLIRLAEICRRNS